MKILIADDHTLYRDGLKFNLNNLFPQAQITEVATFNELLKKCNSDNCYDMILANLDISNTSWETTISQIQSKTSAKIGIFSSSNNPVNIKKAANMGVCCYIHKNINTKVLQSALSLVFNGGSYFPQNLFNRSDEKNKFVGEHKLTNRQSEVLKYLSQGLSNKQIAYHMNVSEATVKLHINALLRSLEATNRTQAVIKSQKLGIV